MDLGTGGMRMCGVSACRTRDRVAAARGGVMLHTFAEYTSGNLRIRKNIMTEVGDRVNTHTHNGG